MKYRAGSTERRATAFGSGGGLLVFALALATLIVAPAGHAQTRSLDYYAPRETEADQRVLRNVEGYHLQPGIDHLRAREFRQAMAEFEFILAVYPNHPRALMLLSDVCEQSRSMECTNAADSWFEKAVAINPNAAATYVMFGIYNHKSHRLDAAIKSYKRALELSPNSVNANYNLGLAYFEQKQYALANEVAQRAYASGASLPGLRDKLKTVGAWHPLESGDSPSPENSTSKSIGERPAQ
jgi:tetratricopeptide (TPR) repeat protein